MEIKAVEIAVPENCNVILGQTHFIKSVEDLYEALVESGPSIKFGLAFSEASGKCLVRSDGNDEKLIELAEKAAMEIAAGHSFIIFMKDAYPINVLNRIKNLSEVCNVFAATANPLQVIVAETAMGRGVMGVVDGSRPKGVETATDKQWRKDFLRKINYKR
ncbi:MAG: adenosine-specific kinase [Candidatus Micrarchaeota archaeon]